MTPAAPQPGPEAPREAGRVAPRGNRAPRPFPQPKPTAGYPSRRQAVAALTAQGMDPEAVAAALGITPNRAREQARSARRETTTVTVDKIALAALHGPAVARQISPHQLVRRMLAILTADPSLISAVLDDDR